MSELGTLTMFINRQARPGQKPTLDPPHVGSLLLCDLVLSYPAEFNFNTAQTLWSFHFLETLFSIGRHGANPSLEEGQMSEVLFFFFFFVQHQPAYMKALIYQGALRLCCCVGLKRRVGEWSLRRLLLDTSISFHSVEWFGLWLAYHFLGTLSAGGPFNPHPCGLMRLSLKCYLLASRPSNMTSSRGW